MVNLNATRGFKSVPNVDFQRSEARKQIKQFHAPSDGEQGISDSMVPDELVSEGMIDRFLEIDPPVFRLVGEYDTIFNEIEHAYVLGFYFSAISAAVVTIERILNTARIELHPHVSPKIKELWDKGATNEWQPNIDALNKWGYLSENLAKELEELYKVRCNYLHTGRLDSLKPDAKRAVKAAYDLAKETIGFPKSLFTLENGGIKCLKPDDPIIQVFYKQHIVVEKDSPEG